MIQCWIIICSVILLLAYDDKCFLLEIYITKMKKFDLELLSSPQGGEKNAVREQLGRPHLFDGGVRSSLPPSGGGSLHIYGGGRERSQGGALVASPQLYF